MVDIGLYLEILEGIFREARMESNGGKVDSKRAEPPIAVRPLD